MDKNSESIYGKSASPFRKLPWGRCTQKEGKLYLHVFDWPEEGFIRIPGLRNKVTKAYTLADKKRLKIRHNGTEWYLRMAQVVKGLNPEDFEISERDRLVTMTEIGESHVESLLEMPLRDPERPEDITPEQARLMGYLEQALRAQYLFRRNKEYLVQAGKVVIIDEFTGRLMPGRRWSDGLHQAVEAKEGVSVQRENVTYATITIQNYFRMYKKLSGMTGTAVTEAEEFDKIYSLDVLAIPTNLEYIASRPETNLIELDDRDEKGYKFTYYADKNDQQAEALFWKRKDYPDVVYRTEEAKLRSITREIMLYNALGKPMLIGTTSVELSDRISNRCADPGCMDGSQ